MRHISIAFEAMLTNDTISRQVQLITSSKLVVISNGQKLIQNRFLIELPPCEPCPQCAESPEFTAFQLFYGIVLLLSSLERPMSHLSVIYHHFLLDEPVILVTNVLVVRSSPSSMLHHPQKVLKLWTLWLLWCHVVGYCWFCRDVRFLSHSFDSSCTVASLASVVFASVPYFGVIQDRPTNVHPERLALVSHASWTAGEKPAVMCQ